jgi:hypothetical protein
MAKPKKIKASTVITPANPKRDNERIALDQAKWVKFYRDNNMYVNDLALRAKRSGTHGAILNDKLTFASGDSLTFSKGGEIIPFDKLDNKIKAYIESVNKFDDSLHEIIISILRGYIFSGNGYCQVAESNGMVFFFKQDFTKPRISKNQDEWYLSSFWRDIKSSDTWDNRQYPVETIPSFIKSNTTKKARLVHIKADTEESDYYGLPDHIGALKWADIEYRIPTYNISKFDNGFMASGILSMFGESPKGMTEQEYVEKIRDKFTGEDKEQKVIVELLDSPDQAAKWNEFSKDKDGEFQGLQDLAVQNIVTAHRWDGTLLGISNSGASIKASDAAQQRTAFERIYNTVIKGYQKPVLKTVNNLLKRMPMFKDIEVGIATPTPVSFFGDLDINNILTVNDGLEALGYDKREDEFGKQIIGKSKSDGKSNNNSPAGS